MRTQGLRHRVEIQEQIEVVDTNGELTRQWVPVERDSNTLLIDVPARVLTGEQPRGAPFLAQQQQNEVAARISFRYKEFPGLNGTHRILWNGRVFDIIGDPSLDETAQREWRCICRAGSDDG